jgi:RNA polymerase sigma-70 factor (ECF subfamily)
VSNQTDVERLSYDARETALEDSRLVAAVLGDEPTAFDELVRRYQRRAVAVAYRLLGDVHDAADVVQDAFLRAYRNLRSLEDHRRFGPWLMRIVSNLSLNFRRSRETGVARQAVGLDELVEGPNQFRSTSGQPLTGGLSPGDPSISGEVQDEVSKAVAALPEKQRLALVLFTIEGMPQKEVAEIMDCSVELVKWNVFQARKTLRRQLAEYLG